MKNVKTNNKGFSLVELIIVIAIMAILIGVLAPQYMKYVEKSRVSADKDLLDSVYGAFTTAYADPDINESIDPGFSFTDTSAEFQAAVKDTLGIDNFPADIKAKLKSKSCKGSAALSVTIDENGNFTVTCGDITIPEVKASSGT